MAYFRCSGGTDPTGNAVEADVLSGKTFSNANGTDKTGSMPSRTNGTSVYSAGIDGTGPLAYIPYGYYPKHDNTAGGLSYVYLTAAQAQALHKHTATYTPNSRNAALDMGENHAYRYVNTSSVPNTNSGTYTYAANSTGGTVDLGATNTYRYVNAANVYAKGKADVSGSILAYKGVISNSDQSYTFTTAYTMAVVVAGIAGHTDGASLSSFYVSTPSGATLIASNVVDTARFPTSRFGIYIFKNIQANTTITVSGAMSSSNNTKWLMVAGIN